MKPTLKSFLNLSVKLLSYKFSSEYGNFGVMAAKLTTAQVSALLDVLKNRFEKNQGRHNGIVWQDVETRLKKLPAKLWSLHAMEESGGEPDVVGTDKNTGAFIFMDCSAESPAGRRSCCFDPAAWEARKEARPQTDAMSMAAEMGIEMLTEEQYRFLQTKGKFDLKTSSWIQTPEKIRALGGALFCDRRYDTVFTYHNGAQSYYAARGFRGVLYV